MGGRLPVGLRAGLLGLVAAVGLGLGLAFVVPLPARLSVPDSTVLEYRDGSVAHVFLAADDRWRLPTEPGHVDPAYVEALVALEDARFWWHPGVDPLAVVRAATDNLRAGRVVSGASTLTMQLVRILEPRPRTFGSKLIEALRAVQLELHLSKTEILAAYLRFAPYGRNLEGVEAAAWGYLGHGSGALTPAETALLLAIPQDPSRRAPSAGDPETTRAARDQVAVLLDAVGALAAPDQDEDAVLAAVLATGVPRQLRPMPRHAPHAAMWMRAQKPSLRPGARVRTTLDGGVQRTAEQVVADVRETARRAGVHGIAVVVADRETGELRALVGGFDFWSPRAGSQIPAFAVARSPGSTLKPLLYARAIEDGRILPEHLLEDVPARFGSYAPRNYDGQHDGMVSAEQALSRSLNIPFVNLLQDVGVESFLADLRAMGVRSLDPRPGHYGLSLVAGGVELQPLELASLYVALAEDGEARTLHWRAQGRMPPRRVYGPGSTWLTRRALRLRDRPDFPARRELSAVPRDLHWKTGTSFGNRDAWSVGSGRRLTVAVWLGNLDQQPSPWLVGAQAAGPVLFDLLEALEQGMSGQLPPPPAELKEVEVCGLSGRLAGPACPRRRPALAREQRVPTERCAMHVEVEVDAETGERVRPGCREGRRVETRTVVQWPAAVQRWLAESWRALPTAPPLAEGCAPEGTAAAPRILSPEEGMVAVLLPGVPASDQDIPLEATGGPGELDWYVDGAWVARAPAEERVWWTPRPGVHELMVVDPAGRSTRQRLEVRQR